MEFLLSYINKNKKFFIANHAKGNHTLKAKLSWRWPTTTTNDGDDGHNHRTEPNHLEAILRVCVCVYVLRTSLVSPFAVGCLAWSIQAI